MTETEDRMHLQIRISRNGARVWRTLAAAKGMRLGKFMDFIAESFETEIAALPQLRKPHHEKNPPKD